MTSQTPDMQAVLERLDRFERQNRRLKQAALAVLILFAAAFMMGQARPTRTTEANKFVLRDADGRVRAELSMFADRPTLTFRDAKGFPVASIAGADDPFLTLNRAGSNEQVELLSSKDHYGLALYGKTVRAGLAVTKGSPGLDIFDEAGKERAMINLAGGDPSFVLFDANGRRRAVLTAFDGSPYLWMTDDKEKQRFSLGIEAKGPNLTLSDDEGFQTEIGNADLVTPETGESHKTSAASVVMIGKDGKVIWRAP